jgi:hypothetical protein
MLTASWNVTQRRGTLSVSFVTTNISQDKELAWLVRQMVYLYPIRFLSDRLHHRRNWSRVFPMLNDLRSELLVIDRKHATGCEHVPCRPYHYQLLLTHRSLQVEVLKIGYSCWITSFNKQDSKRIFRRSIILCHCVNFKSIKAVWSLQGIPHYKGL